MAIITYRDIVPLRGNINPEQRKIIETHYAQTNAQLAELAHEAANLMTRRRDTIDTALAIRNRLYPEHWFHGRRRPEPDAPALPPIEPNAIHLHGRALRQLCRDILRNNGPQTLTELHSTLHILGYAINTHWPTKTLADAMRYEVTTGNAQRLKRGVYQITNHREHPTPYEGETNLHTQGGPPFTITVNDLCGSSGQRTNEPSDDVVDRADHYADPSSELSGHLEPISGIQGQQARKPGRIERHVNRALKPCTRTGPALAYPHNLSTAHHHLARPEPGETHDPRPRRRHQRPVVHHSGVTDNGRPTRAQPLERPTDIVRPERIASRDQHVDPRHLVGHYENGSPTTAATNDVKPSDGPYDRERLRRAKGQPNRGHGVHPHRPRKVTRHRNSRMKRRHRLGKPTNVPAQDARAKYGFHESGTRPTDTTIHASSRGVNGGRANRMFASSGVRSRLRKLHGRHAATTFVHSCCPPRLRGMTWSIESARPLQY
jgi:hypothetical protein